MSGDNASASERLQWIEPLGLGYLPPRRTANELYDEQYWAEYRRRDATPMGEALTRARVDLVERYCDPSECVDVGIGGGAFVEHSGCLGVDVNPLAIEWLRERGRLWDGRQVRAMTFWDSAEHISDMSSLLAHSQRFVFISMPVYTSRSDAVESRHFKPDEHVWYFTIDGLDRMMRMNGFWMLDYSRVETELGRHGIVSFAFERN